MKNFNPQLRILSLLVLGLLFPLLTKAQMPSTCAGYIFSAYTGTYTPLTGGTPVPSIQADDANFQNIPIGFTFPFTTGNYTVLSACSNGFLSLSNSSSNTLTNSSGGATSYGPLMMPLWDDQNGSPAGQASYKTTGTAPNRVFTFEFASWRWYYNSTGNNVISYQVKLYESGRIEFVYNQGPDPANSSLGTIPTATIGIAKSGSDFQTLNNSSANPVSSSTVFTDNLNGKPLSGQVYSWDKPLPNNVGVFAFIDPATNFCVGSQQVKVQIQNYGGNAINSVRVNWSINGVVQPFINYTTTIPVNGNATVLLGSTMFPSSVVPVNIQAWTSLPNGVADTKPGDDSLAVSRKALDPPNAVIYYTTKRICPGDSLLLQAGTGPDYTYQWQLDADPISGATQSTYYAKTEGNYSVKVANPGCMLQSPFYKITVRAPQVDLGPDKILCETIPALTLDALEPDCSYLWSTGDTTQTISASEGSNTYWVQVTLGANCSSSDTVILQIDPLPKLNGISSTSSGSTYYFSPAGPKYVTNYLWDFGDGSVDTNTNVSHTYSVAGPYEVTLTAYNNCGETKSKVALPLGVPNLPLDKQVVIYPNPAQNTLTVNANAIAIKNVKIFNTLGALTYSQQVTDKKKLTIDVSNLPNGTYTIVVNTGSGNINKIFAVNR